MKIDTTSTSDWLTAMRKNLALLDISDGAPLPPQDRALVRLGLAASVTSLNMPAVDAAIRDCFQLGATPQQVQEIVSVVSGLGVHSLMVTSAAILGAAVHTGYQIDGPLSDAEAALWKARVGDDPFWTDMDTEVPGFLKALLRLSPAQFEAFFEYCAVPWHNGVVRARIKELLAMACDATAAHVFGPGFRLHLTNAIKLGAGRLAIDECIDLALAAPPHHAIDRIVPSIGPQSETR